MTEIRQKQRKGAERLNQDEHLDDSGSRKTSSVLSVGKLFPGNLTSVQTVGRNNTIRITIAAETFVAFSDDSEALDSATVNASLGEPFWTIRLGTAGTYELAAPAKYVKASTNPSRTELIQ